MYGLYDKEGILRFVNSDKEACLDYAELFQLKSSQFCLMNFMEYLKKNDANKIIPNQVENNN